MNLRPFSFTSLAALTFLAACNDKTPGSDDAGTEVGDGDGDTTGDGDGDGDTTGDGDGDGECTPPGEAFATFAVLNSDGFEEANWDLLCTLDSVGPGDGESGHVIALIDCVSQNGGDDQPLVELFVDSNPASTPLELAAPGTSLHLRFVAIPPFIPGRWFTLRGAPSGTLLLAGFDGPSLYPFDQPGFDYAPLELELVPLGCTPFEHESQCGLAERQGLQVGFDRDVATISDANFGYVGELVSYQIIVDELLDFPELTCDDFPNQILTALFFSIPEG